MIYKVIKDFKSHCVCHKVYKVGEQWELLKMTSKKRAHIVTSTIDSRPVHKVKLSRALANSEKMGTVA